MLRDWCVNMASVLLASVKTVQSFDEYFIYFPSVEKGKERKETFLFSQYLF